MTADRTPSSGSVLSPLDAAFLRLESASSPMHIASLAVFEGPPPALEELRALVASRLDQLPRYRQVVTEAPLWLGRPMWTDDRAFDVAQHVRAVTVPAPGDGVATRELCSRLLERHLDRERPLWESWLVDGLADGRWGLLSKVHHCMVDGVAGTDLLARVLELSADATVPEPGPAWSPTPPPGVVRRARAGLPGPPSPRALAHRAAHPRETARTLTADARGLLRWLAAARPLPGTPLVGPVGKARDWVWADVSLREVRAVGHALGGTVNDVAETLVCSALRDLLTGRGLPLEHNPRALVPVSVRSHRAGGDVALDANEVSALLLALPVDVEDPRARFEAVKHRLQQLKHSGQAEAGELLTAAAGYVSPAALSLGLVGVFHLPHRHLSTVTTNVPGPPIPLYALGRRLRELHPYVPIADRLRLGFAVTSYDDRLWFGVTVDRSHVDDADGLALSIEKALRELRAVCDG